MAQHGETAALLPLCGDQSLDSALSKGSPEAVQPSTSAAVQLCVTAHGRAGKSLSEQQHRSGRRLGWPALRTGQD